MVLFCLFLAFDAFPNPENTEHARSAEEVAEAARPDADNTSFEMEKMVEGKCPGSNVYVRASKQNPGSTRLFVDHPESAEVFFCGSTIENCTNYQNGLPWVQSPQADAKKLVMSTFVPGQNQSVTILRKPPKSAGADAKACFQEVTIDSFEGTGKFSLKAKNIGWGNKDATQVLAEVNEGFRQLAERQRLAASQQFTQIQSPQFGGQRFQGGYPNGQVFRQPQYGFNQPNYGYYTDYQQIAQARANAMAATGTFGHYGIPGAPPIEGVSEGIGYAYGTLPQTCFFTGPVLADATAQAADGRIIRVRFFNGGRYTGASI